MRHYSQNVWICVIPDILLLHPVNAQGEYNIPSEDNENGDDGGALFAPAPPGRSVPYQAPLPWPLPKNQGKGQNPNPPVLPKPTSPGSTPSESESDDFYVPKTPSLRTPSRDSDSSHSFFNPIPGPCDDPLCDEKLVTYGNPNGSPFNIQYNYMRHARQLSWDWHNPTTECRYNLAAPVQGWYERAGCPDQGPHQISPTPAAPRQLTNLVVNPLRCSGQQRQLVTQPDNVYGDEAPVDIFSTLHSPVRSKHNLDIVCFI